MLTSCLTTFYLNPFLIFHGHLSNFQVNDGGSSAALGMTITSHFGNFEKINGRTTSDISQQRFFSGDQGMEFSSQTVQDIKWGRE